MAMLAFVLTTGLMTRAGAASCLPGTVAISITSAVDVQNLTDSLGCEGKGYFDITWHSNVTIDERIEVSDGKHVTVTADAFNEDNAADVIIDDGSGTGIFSVSDGSALRLNNIGLRGGNAEHGGAVAVLSSSALYIYGCTFTRNNASTGGETPRAGCDAICVSITESPKNYVGATLVGDSRYRNKQIPASCARLVQRRQ